MSCDFFLIGKKVTHRFPSRSRGTYYGGRLFSSSCYYAAAIATVPILQLYTYMCVCYRYCYVLLLFVFNFTNHFFCESGKVLIFSVFSFLVKKISSKIASLPFARRCFLARYCSMTSSCLFSAAFSFISLIFTCSSRKRLCPFIVSSLEIFQPCEAYRTSTRRFPPSLSCATRRRVAKKTLVFATFYCRGEWASSPLGVSRGALGI